MFLRQNTFLHLYEIGDLDDFFWQYTTWYALKVQNQIQQLVLLYTGTPYLPTLVGLTIGLNVKADNISAIACYQNLGFEQVATYDEYSLELK